MSQFTVTQPQYDALREVYLYTFDAFSTNPVDVEQASDVPSVDNPRTAREMLGLLVQVGLLVTDAVEGEDVWQVGNPGTYDDHDRSEAESVFDQFFGVGESEPEPEVAPTPAPSATPSEPRAARAETPTGDLPDCICGCGAKVGKKSFYKPGHDARHAGNVARAIAERVASGAARDDAMAQLNELPSTKLRNKAEDMADRIVGKAAKRVEEKPVEEEPAPVVHEEDTTDDTDPGEPVEEEVEPDPENGFVTVRGKQIDATRYADGTVMYVKSGTETKATAHVAGTFTTEA